MMRTFSQLFGPAEQAGKLTGESPSEEASTAPGSSSDGASDGADASPTDDASDVSAKENYPTHRFDGKPALGAADP